MAVEAWWWPLSPWLSPAAAWFLFFNAVVCAIAVMSRGQQPQPRQSLARTASSVVLDRLRSISIFSSHTTAGYYSHTAPPVPHPIQEPEEEVPVSRAVSEAELQPQPSATAGESGVTTTPPPSSPAATEAAAVEEEEENISLEEAYALARRGRDGQKQPQAAAAAATAETGAKAGRRGWWVEGGGKEEVNARADDFIRQFREDLKMQRLKSILNYTQMLKRGAAR